MCASCLRVSPFYDGIRHEPAFAALIGEQETKMAAQRQRLADTELLFTPEEVLQLEDFSFDPFLIE